MSIRNRQGHALDSQVTALEPKYCAAVSRNEVPQAGQARTARNAASTIFLCLPSRTKISPGRMDWSDCASTRCSWRGGDISSHLRSSARRSASRFGQLRLEFDRWRGTLIHLLGGRPPMLFLKKKRTGLSRLRALFPEWNSVTNSGQRASQLVFESRSHYSHEEYRQVWDTA